MLPRTGAIMKRTLLELSTLALGICAMVSAPLQAQWPGFRTPGVPRLANGKVDHHMVGK